MAKKGKAIKKKDPNDSGISRNVDVSEPLPGIPSITWDFKKDDPAELERFLIETNPLLAAYRAADKARHQFPLCTNRNAEYERAYKALKADGVANAINEALIDARFHWGNEGSQSTRAAFVAGWCMAMALVTWGKGAEILRKKNLKTGGALGSLPMSEKKREKRDSNPLKTACSLAWEEYLEEAGDKASRKAFVKDWLRKNRHAFEIERDHVTGKFSKGGFEAGPDTIRRWKL